jgi:hypothetical protein
MTVNPSDDERVAGLLALLRPAPERAVLAAQELPLIGGTVDGIVERAQQDEAFRRALIADLESTLEAEGHDLGRTGTELLRHRLTQI